MTAGVRPAHQHRLADLLIMEVLRDGTSLIALDRQVEEPRRTWQRRWRIGPLHLLAVDRGMDVQKVTGQHVQRGVGWQLETKGLCVVGVRLDVGQLVRSSVFSS